MRMSFPVLHILWRCVTAGLELGAAHHWTEARQLAAAHEVDIDRALQPFPSIPAGENFLSHPFLQACLLEKPESHTLISMHAPAFILGDALRENLPSLGAGNPTRLKAVLAQIDPEDLPQSAAGKPAAQILLQYTEQCDIPWAELSALAAKAPVSRLPPPGFLPPRDNYTPPLMVEGRHDNLMDLISLAELRFHSLAAMKNPGAARDCLLIQSRVAGALLEDGTLSGAMMGSLVVTREVSQIQAGFVAGLWRDEDIPWIREWAASIDFRVTLTTAMRNGCLHTIRTIEGIRLDPGIPRRLARYILEDEVMNILLETEDLEKMACEASLPFNQDALAPFRSLVDLIYHRAPHSAFKLWKAAEVRKICLNHLPLLQNGGLAAYAWPKEEKRREIHPVSFAEIGSLAVSAQSQMNLLHSACALRQWKSVHGSYPPTLKHLTSPSAPGGALPDSALVDVCTGKPLIYQRLSPSAYRLRSTGPNRRDDGGKPIRGDKGDLIWQ